MGVRLFTPRASATAAPRRSVRSHSVPAGPLPETLALVLVALAVYLSLALSSLQLDPSDPDVSGGNWVGPVGATCASVLAQGFGVVAWLAPLELLWLAVPLFRERQLRLSGLRLAGDVLMAIVASALVHVASPHAEVFGALRVGGNVGLLFGELMSALFSTLGSYLVGLTLIGLILIGRSEFSFIQWCEQAIEGARLLGLHLRHLLRYLTRVWHAASELRRLQPSTERVVHAGASKSALASLDFGEPWVPLERTGRPPLVIADSLRAAFPSSGMLYPETPTPAPVFVADLDLAGDGQEAEAAAAGSPLAPSVAPRPGEEDLLDDWESSAGEDPCEDPGSEPASSRLEGSADARGGEDGLGGNAPPSGDEGAALAPKIVDTTLNSEVERSTRRRVRARAGRFELPSTELLLEAKAGAGPIDEKRVFELAQRLETTLLDYGVTGKVEEVHPGPTVTTYEVSPLAGTKVSKVAGLCDDLALGLSRKVRIIAPIPGKARIGFELPNDTRTPVSLRELVEDERFEALAGDAALPVVLGRNIVGAPFFADLAAMPHVIVAGATGAGKSVGLNVMLSSLLFKRTPDELRMLMVDPKVVELAPFDGIPHMLLPVVTDMKQANKALKWAVDEMERRYQAFATAGTKNITTYNQWTDRVQRGELPAPPPAEVEALTADGQVVTVAAAQTGTDGVALPGRMPHIVIVVDEFADLMMQQGKEVEASVARLAQKARAAGMHVVLATQRPSVDVITGMIKANFPTRIAFRVAQKVDSRTILDEMGAELLLGKGDMLVKLNGSTDTHRVQCPFISEEEVNELTAYLRTQGTPEYRDIILQEEEDEGDESKEQPLDPRYDEAVAIVAQTQRCSTSWLQRKLTIGYNRAAKIVEAMEANGVVGPANGAKDREIYVHAQ